MFKRKPTTPPGRMRPNTTGERQNASVFSYRASRSAPTVSSGARNASDVAAGPAADRRRQGSPSRPRRLTRLVFGIVLLGTVVANLFLSTTPRLMALHKAGANGELFLHTEDQYRAAARELLAGSPLYRSKPTINTKKIASDMSKQFPELGSITVSVPFVGANPVFYLEPAVPALLLATKNNEVYVLDVSGKALATLAQTRDLAKRNLPAVVDESNLPVRLGQPALPSTNVAFITEVIGQLRAKQLTISAITLPRGTSELHVRISGAPYTIKFNLHGNARVEVGAFLAVKQKLDKEHTVPGSYVDVRVDNRAYYR